MLRAPALVVVLGAVASLGVPVAPAHAGVHLSPRAAAIVASPPGNLDIAGGVEYHHPVDAEVVDPFRPPATPYGAGNRGLKYATAPGAEVRAVADGVVVFAGQVGGALHVTVAHPDGRLSSYSGVATIAVRRFQTVRAGETVARSREVLHVGMREDGRYIDPASLFGRTVEGARLVPESPVGGGGWRSPGQELVELRLIAGELGGGGGLSSLGRLAGRVGGWAGSLVERGTAALGVTAELARSGWDLVVTHGPTLLALAWTIAPYVLAYWNPVLAGVIFLVAVPLLTGELPPVVHFAADLFMFYPRVIERSIAWWAHRQHCTPAGVEPPAPSGRRVAVLVGGLDSTSEHAAIGRLRTDELGYHPGDVVGFSYVGGRTPDVFDGSSTELAPELADLPANHYGRPDSSRGLRGRGELLADLLTDIADRSPGASIDLYTHSQGGLVTREALHVLERRPGGDEVIARLGLVATIATPHHGSDLAALSVGLTTAVDMSIAVRLASSITGATLHPGGTNVADLAPGSAHLRQLHAGGLPAGPDYLSLGARGDLVVTEARSRLPGARHVTLPGFGPSIHSDLVDQPATTRELALGLADLPPTCEGLWEFVGDLAVSELIQVSTSAIGFRLTFQAVPLAPADILEPLVRW
jgi:triacylglycerol esterase/lipase EstA (alpha/beta hydrolase family)